MTTCFDLNVNVENLILASTSPYRRDQLTQFGLSFKAVNSGVNELCQENESPVSFALRMAEAKANAVADKYPESWVIGADQVCEFEGEIIRKPGNHNAAVNQLLSFSNKTVLFHSALTVAHKSSGGKVSSNTITKVSFKNNSRQFIDEYLYSDQPYDCAGSFKVESQGLRLMRTVESTDPSALIGLPLIALCQALGKLSFPYQ